jgi:periplasmic divalent cation tolerance protein
MVSGDNMEIVVLVTAKDEIEADKIAEHLVRQKLAACANVLSGINSFFRWRDKLDKAEEVLLIVKTRKSLFKKLERAVRSLHSYDLPEIIALPIIMGSKDYLDWVRQSTSSAKGKP